MSNSNNNQINIPQTREAMDRFKMPIRPGGNQRLQWSPDLPGSRRPRQRRMVKKRCPVRSARFERQSRTAVGHLQRVAYIAAVMI